MPLIQVLSDDEDDNVAAGDLKVCILLKIALVFCKSSIN